MERPELDKLSTDELHERAIKRAVTHLDVAFLWQLLKALPVAEVASDRLGAAETDVISLSSMINDLAKSDEGQLGEALRPLYLDYLTKHRG